MIVYGWNSKNVKNFDLPNSKCDQCGATGKKGSIHYRYAHIFWIPLFPYKKVAATQCNHCNHVADDTLSADTQMHIEQAVGNVKPPIYLFIGAILLLGFIGWVANDSYTNRQERAAMIANPQVGDIFVLKGMTEQAEYPYSMMQVFRTSADSVDIVYSQYVYNEAAGFKQDIRKHAHEDVEYWDPFYFTVARTQVQEWATDGDVSRTIRGEPIYADTTFSTFDEEYIQQLLEEAEALQEDMNEPEATEE